MNKRPNSGTCIKYIYFLFSLTSLSSLFHSYRDEPIGRRGETGVHMENHLTHPQAELGLSHMYVASAGLEPTPDTEVTFELGPNIAF